jgi:Tol biopolymer transport system component
MRTPGRPIKHRMLALAALALTMSIGGSGAQAAETCPNAALRTGPSAGLPDCRAYELVSPANKNGYDVDQAEHGGSTTSAVAAREGDGLAIGSAIPLPGSMSAAIFNEALSRRGANGWVTQPLSPPQAPSATIDFTAFPYFTPDLGHAFVSPPPGPALAAGATPGVSDLYLRDNATGSYTAVAGGTPSGAYELDQMAYGFDGASSDFTHVLVTSIDALTPDAPTLPALPNLYEWVNGHLRLASIMPDGTPSPTGANPGSPIGIPPSLTAISKDGSRIVFGTPLGQIYVREDGERTVEASASQRSTPDPHGAIPFFWGASSDGSEVFFTSVAALTDDATIGAVSLYRYDVDTGTLTDLSVDADPETPPGGGVSGVLGIAEDGSRGYFHSTRQYVAGKGVFGLWNLYMWHGDTISYVLTDDYGDPSVYEFDHKTARISPDGERLIFASSRSLTGYDNTDAKTGARDSEVFLYDAPSDRVICVSCNPSGERPVGPATLPEPPASQVYNLQRGVSDDGRRVFFESHDALVAQDSNSKQDVYEYEDGQVRLISTGSSSENARFVGASASGDDAFFTTREQLVAADGDENRDYYDARVDGGFPADQVAAAKPCSGDECQGASTPPSQLSLPGTSLIAGFGNVPASATASMSVTKPRAVTGTATSVRVKVSGAGGITIAGVSIGKATRPSSAAGTYSVRVALNARARSTLRRKRTLTIELRVTFRPASGQTVSKVLTLTFKQPRAAKQHARAAGKGR